MRKVILIYMSQNELVNENGINLLLPSDQLESVCDSSKNIDEEIDLIIKHKKSSADWLYKNTPWVFNPHSYYAVERLIRDDMSNEDYWNFLVENNECDSIGTLNSL